MKPGFCVCALGSAGSLSQPPVQGGGSRSAPCVLGKSPQAPRPGRAEAAQPQLGTQGSSTKAGRALWEWGRGPGISGVLQLPASLALTQIFCLDLDLASQEKERLEEKQREARRERAKEEAEWRTR